jgi:hypothetical protein
MRKLLIPAALLFIPYCVFAQFSLGVRANPFFFNGNGTTGNTGNSYELKSFIPFPKIGGIFKYRFHENFALHTEINYNVAGFSYEIEGSSFSLEYIELPLLFQFTGKTRFRGYAEAGISPKFLIRARHHLSHAHDSDIDYYDAKNYFNPFMLTANIGGGIMFDIWRLTLFAGARVGYDIIPIGKRIYDVNDVRWTFDNMRFLHIELLLFGITYNFQK